MKYLLKLIIGIYLLCPIFSQAQVIQHQISDDGYVRVPLQFPFPLYGRVFTESYMFSNGVIGFLNPTNSWCCNGFDLRNSTGSPFDYAIMPLQTDLLNYSGRFLTEGTPQYQRYVWENISEYGAPNRLNTFGVEIRPSGYIGMHYEQVNLSPWRQVTIGVTGNTSQGEFTQLYYGNGFSQTNFSHIIESTGNTCITNPLSSPSCAGYQEAYTAQQCAISPLYSPSCVGYEVAYHDQQCSLNALYATSCQGYEQAYFNRQCSLNPLYNSQCQGYAEAYHSQQCSLNPLYAVTCSGYRQAYYNQQCGLNPLYDRTCTGYAEAYALANVVPATTQTVSTTTPSVQVSTTGTVSVETPIVADTVVNEVITRPQVSNANPTTTTQTVQTQRLSQAEPKAEKKSEVKQVATVKKTEAKNDGTAEAPKIVAPVHEYKAPIILDLAYMKMVKKPIKDNNIAMYNLLMNSQHKHEVMVDEQYRR